MRGWTRVPTRGGHDVVREVVLTDLQRQIVLDVLEQMEAGRESGVLDASTPTINLAIGRGGGKSTILCTLNEIDRRHQNLAVLIDEGRR